MTAKSIVQVEVQDEQFREFYSLFQEYQEKLAEGSDAWKATTESIDDAEGAMEKLLDLSGQHADAATIAAYQATVIAREIRAASASNNALLEGLTKNTKAQKGFANETERSNKAFERLKKNVDGVAHSIFGIGKWILKLGALGGGLAGLGGLLSGIGLKDLAASAVDNQRSARGLGMTTGQLTAFKQDLGDYIDPGVLASVASAQSSYEGRMWLSRALGVRMDEVSSMDPGRVAGQLAMRAHDWWANTPDAMRTKEVYQSTGLAQSGISFDLARQEGNTPMSVLQQRVAMYDKDQSQLNQNNTDAWANFLREIKQAGNTIETSLQNKLVALAPDLQRFVDAVGKDAGKLIDEIFTPANLQALENGIDKLSDYLGSQRFQQDMKDFADLVGDVVGALRKVHNFFNPSRGTPDSAAGQVPNVPVGLDPDEVRRETKGRVGNFGGISATDKALGYARHFLNMPSNPEAFLADLEKKNDLPAGSLVGQWEKESSKGKNLVGPVLRNGDQAIGDFQFTSDTWKQWGKNGDRFNFKDEANAAASYMSFLKTKYKGDVSKALAAYNWGPGNLDKDIAKNGANWQAGLPSETRNYLNKIVAAIARQQPGKVQVTVTNNTAARVAVQANAAAAQ